VNRLFVNFCFDIVKLVQTIESAQNDQIFEKNWPREDPGTHSGHEKQRRAAQRYSHQYPQNMQFENLILNRFILLIIFLRFELNRGRRLG
jgi:hypothetical protein